MISPRGADGRTRSCGQHAGERGDSRSKEVPDRRAAGDVEEVGAEIADELEGGPNVDHQLQGDLVEMPAQFEDAVDAQGELLVGKKGVVEELEPIQDRIDNLTGDDDEAEPEASRLEDIRADLKELQGKAEGEAKEAIADAREKIETYRQTES